MKHEQLSQEAQDLKPGVYRHFKGGMYQVLGVGRDSETEEEKVIYQKLYGDFTLWVRPLKMFLDSVERDGFSGPRFEFIGKNR